MKKFLTFLSVSVIILSMSLGIIAYGEGGTIVTPPIPVDDVIYYPKTSSTNPDETENNTQGEVTQPVTAEADATEPATEEAVTSEEEIPLVTVAPVPSQEPSVSEEAPSGKAELPTSDGKWEGESVPFDIDDESENSKQDDKTSRHTTTAPVPKKTDVVSPTTTTKAPAKKVSKPKKSAIKKLKRIKNKIKVTWKKVKGVSGYQLQYSTKKNMKKAKTVTIKGAKKKTRKIKAKKKKTYYVRIRTYKGNGKNRVYSNWSKAKKIK